MIVEMREDDKNLWVRFNPGKGDPREIIVDEVEKDVRVANGKDVIKIVWNKDQMVVYKNDIVMLAFH